MQVGCTRKLLDYIGVIAEPVDVQLDPILSWSANTITINHHHAIVIANDSSRYGFVLYGIKSKDIKEFGHLVVDGVRACLETECIDPSLIQRYLIDCGEHVAFTKTANRSVVTRLNQLCTYGVMWYADEYTTGQLIQRQLIHRINDDFITVKNGQKRDYVNVYEKLGEDLGKRYGVHPYRCQAAEFEVELELASLCRRRIIVPMGYTFRQFHHILQKLFCWQDYHLHDFWIERHPNGRLKHTLIGSPREYDLEEESTREDALVRLSEIFPHYDHIVYNYDFGDNWIHHIRLLGIIDGYDKNHAVCLSGEGNAPPEDVGGPGEYARLLRILADPRDPDHDDMQAWCDSGRYRPFDLEQVNWQLR